MSIDEVKEMKSHRDIAQKKKKIYVSTKLPLSRSSSQYEKFETFSNLTSEGKNRFNSKLFFTLKFEPKYSKEYKELKPDYFGSYRKVND